MEEILPIGFSSQVVEPLVLSKIFNNLFEILDPRAYEILEDIPSALFVKYFVCFFAEYPNEDVSLFFEMMVVDLPRYHGSSLSDGKRFDDVDPLTARTCHNL